MTALTGADGAFSFTGLSAGLYCVSVDAADAQNVLLLAPGTWTFPAPDAGSVTVTVAAGERKENVNFGWDYQLLPEPAPVTPQPTSTPTSVPTPTATPTPVTTECYDKVSFLGDVNVPDNTRFAPGEAFVKTWRLRNSGTCTWTADYALVLVSGNGMGASTIVPLPRTVLPGDTIDLSVKMVAPAGAGTYKGYWQLRNGRGQLFGVAGDTDPAFWVQIIVGPAATPTPIKVTWLGECFANRDLAGKPTLVRSDPAINFAWGNAAPDSSLPADGFSVRWSRTLPFKADTYRFYAHSDDGVRVWVDGQVIIDHWQPADGVTYRAERTMSAGDHNVRVEYFENGGAAKIWFWVERLGEFPQWRGAYYSNVGLAGASELVRNDAVLDLNWGSSAPAGTLPADNFSVRWTQDGIFFEGGLYRFHAVVDDGVRLFVDDAPIIDNWRDGARREVTADAWLTGGSHNVRVEYYERNGDALIRVWWERLASFPDWKGEYWPNRNLAGNPTLVRNDVKLNFNWGEGAPASNLPANDFAARWTRTIKFEAATYRFHVLVDDGARLWVDGQLLVDAWRDGSIREIVVDQALTRGKHTVRVEYFERAGVARIRVWWEAIPLSFTDWKGEYWPNRNLSGDPILVRNDKSIDFKWGEAPVAPGLPTDNYSARWSRKVTFKPGVYRFTARADDGIRVYLDGKVLLNEWHDKGDTAYTAERSLSGEHRLVVEFYEKGGSAWIKFGWKRVDDLRANSYSMD